MSDYFPNSRAYGLHVNIPRPEEIRAALEDIPALYKAEIHVRIGTVEKDFTIDEFAEALGMKEAL